MPQNRFYIDSDLIQNLPVFIEGTEHHHLTRVMRLSTGEQIELVNGRGVLACGKISDIKKKQTVIQIFESVQKPPLSPRILLAIPFMRPSKLEWIVEKGTELGADAFLFYRAVHSEKDELSAHQQERLKALAIAALKQSGRLYLPSFEIIPDLSSLFTKEAFTFFGDPLATELISWKFPPSGTTLLFITGPEKGFSSQEEINLNKHAKGICLSNQILRAETAPIAAIAILRFASL
jgi:16S rRNA (uracil1498-N3)-methyltransferase